MFDYTKAAITKVVDDFKRLDYVRNIATQILYILYLVYALVAGAGIFIANALLLLLSVAYFVFFMIVTTGKLTRAKAQTRKTVRRVFTRCKQLVKLFTLGVMVYGIYAATTHVTPLSVVLSALLIVGWVLQLVFEVVFRFFVNRASFLIEGLEADYENLVKPAKTVGNFFKKLTGKELEPEKERTKTRVWLDEKVAENKAEKKEKKARTKRAKRKARIEEKRAARQKRIDAKNTVFLPPPDERAPEPEATEVFEEPPQITE
ncbi:MAG: hypothetical protein IJ514_02390 [Clostridia bacterium]|nr:hypothetical protein [Clostridia bacterium]